MLRGPVNESAGQGTSRLALGVRQQEDERHGGVAGSKANTDRDHEHVEALIGGSFVQEAEEAAQPDYPLPVKKVVGETSHGSPVVSEVESQG